MSLDPGSEVLEDDLGAIRLLAIEILPGDRRKFDAQSNDSDTGGGARDLRIRPDTVFATIIGQLFPKRVTVQRTLKGRKVELPAWSGTFSWIDDDGRRRSAEALVWPPTGAREGELRLSKVHEQPCFRHVPPTTEGRLLLLVIQTPALELWPRFATEQSLQEGEWDEEVATFLVKCLQARRRKGVSARGFLDLTTGERFINGR